MVKYFLNPFGTAGDKTVIPNDVQVSGSVSYASGWGIDYQKNLATDPTAKPVPRSQTNQLMFDVTENIQQYQRHGNPEFITTADNGGTPFPYAKYAIVRYDDSGVGTNYKLFQSLVDGNTSLPTNAVAWYLLEPWTQGVPVGTIIDFGGASIPVGYLACNGTSLVRADWPALFAAIGVAWGSTDVSHFTLPSLGRRTKVGYSVAGATPVLGNTVGSIGGTETHALNANENGNHIHGLGGFVGGAVDDGGPPGSVNVGTATFNVTQASGLGLPHNIMQPSGVVYMCIKY